MNNINVERKFDRIEFELNYKCYQELLRSLVNDKNKDKYLLIANQKLVGLYISLKDACDDAYKKCWNDSFYLDECKSEEPIYLDSRALI